MGGCDGIYTSFLLIGLYLCLKNSPYKGCTFLGLALAVKLQAAFVFPIFLFLLAYKVIHIRHLCMIPAVFIIISLPSWVCGRTLSSIIGIYADQMQTYGSLSMGAPTLWALFPFAYYDLLLPMSFCINMIVVLLFTFLTFYLKQLKNKNDFWDILFIFALIVPYFLPKMHERYFYMAVTLSVLYLMRYPKMWKWVLGIVLIDLLGYISYLFNHTVIGIKYLSLGYLCIILRIMVHFFEAQENSVAINTSSNFEKKNVLNKKLSSYFNLFLYSRTSVLLLAIIISFMISFCILKSDYEGKIEIKKPFDFPAWMSFDRRIKVIGPGWEEELVFISDNVIMHPAHRDVALVVSFDDNELVLRWGGHNEERFIKNEDEFYRFKS